MLEIVGQRHIASSVIALVLAGGWLFSPSAASSALAQFDVMGISWTGDVYRLNSQDGTGSLLGRSGFDDINALARDPMGTIYATSGFAGTSIIQINPNTGLGTLVSMTSVNSVRSASFSPEGIMYVTDDLGTGMDDSLWTVDPLTGDALMVGSTGRPGIQAMAITSDGTIYAWDVGAPDDPGWGLMILDPVTGMGTDINPAVGGDAEIQGLCADQNDQLYGGRDALYRIDRVSGVDTFVGSGDYMDLRGIEFLTGPQRFSITVSGVCPGVVKIIWTGATPNSISTIIAGSQLGSTTIPTGAPCAGTRLGLAGNVFKAVPFFRQGPAGQGSFQDPLLAQACGYYLQMIDGQCRVSNVDQIP